MVRYKCKVKLSRDSGFSGKQDTPVKPALSRRNKFRRLPPIKHHEAIPEEPDLNVPTVKSAHPALKSQKPINPESALHSPVVTSKGNTSSPATPVLVNPGHQMSPAGHPTTHITLSPRALTCAVTPDQGSILSSIMESELTLSSADDEEEDDCCSSSSSLPSPEIFRKESYVETFSFTDMEDPISHHPYMKNSTLLDVSHAESIHMCCPPNLSTIIDDSSVLSKKQCAINPLPGPEVETKLATVSLKTVKPSPNPGTTTSPKPNIRRPISYKKKVWFKSPIISETFDAQRIAAQNVTPHTVMEPVRTAEGDKPDTDASRTGERKVKEGALRLGVPPKRPETAKFFDFATVSDEDMFFQVTRERSARLQSVPLFPVTAVKPTDSLVL